MIAMGVQHAHVAVDRHADEDDGALLGQGAPQQCLQERTIFSVNMYVYEREKERELR